MPRGPTNAQRMGELEERVARLERRPTRVATGISAGDLNDRLEQEIKPLVDRIRALQAIVQAYETVLVAILQAYEIEAEQQIANAVRLSWQNLTQDQKEIVGDLLRSL